MPHERATDHHLRNPERVVGPDGSRGDGRPTRGAGDIDDPDAGRSDDAPTDAPEEEGATPSTEHAPGGDL